MVFAIYAQNKAIISRGANDGYNQREESQGVFRLLFMVCLHFHSKDCALYALSIVKRISCFSASDPFKYCFKSFTKILLIYTTLRLSLPTRYDFPEGLSTIGQVSKSTSYLIFFINEEYFPDQVLWIRHNAVVIECELLTETTFPATRTAIVLVSGRLFFYSYISPVLYIIPTVLPSSFNIVTWFGVIEIPEPIIAPCVNK